MLVDTDTLVRCSPIASYIRDFFSTLPRIVEQVLLKWFLPDSPGWGSEHSICRLPFLSCPPPALDEFSPSGRPLHPLIKEQVRLCVSLIARTETHRQPCTCDVCLTSCSPLTQTALRNVFPLPSRITLGSLHCSTTKRIPLNPHDWAAWCVNVCSRRWRFWPWTSRGKVIVHAVSSHLLSWETEAEVWCSIHACRVFFHHFPLSSSQPNRRVTNTPRHPPL